MVFSDWNKLGMQLHGSTPYKELRELGIAPSEIVDFSASVNPLPAPIDFCSVFIDIDFKNYPDRESVELINSISKCYSVDLKYICASAGTTEIIYALPKLFFKPLLLSPVYGDYEDAFQRENINVQKMIFSFLMSEGIDSAIEKLEDHQWDILIIVNPNNPTGEFLEYDEIEQILKKFSDRTILVDEAYQELGEDCSSALPLVAKYDNLIVLRSLTKSYGLPAIRCGWLSTSEKLKGELCNMLTPWQIGKLDEAVFIEVLENKDEYEKQWRKILVQKELMIKKLTNAGIQVYTGRAPFFLLDVENASSVRLELLEKFHIHVRDCTSFGLDNYIRIMPGLEESNNRLISAILQILS